MGCVSSRSPSSAVPMSNDEVSAKSVAVIGGGIAGLSAAYYMAKKGMKVSVFEQNTALANETSYGPAGVTMWKHVHKRFDKDGTIDLTAAGNISGTVSFIAGLAEGAAWSLWSDSADEREKMMLEARETFLAFTKENPEAAEVTNTQGLLYMLDEEYFNKNKKELSGDSSFQFFTKVEFEASSEYDSLFDDCEYHGVILSKEEGYVDPHRIVELMGKCVESMGGEVRLGHTVERLAERDNGVDVIVRGKGENKFDACVVALGAFPAPLLEASGFKDDVDEIMGMKGYSITVRMPEGTLRRGVVDGMDTKFVRPFLDKQGNYCVRLGGVADSYDSADPYKINWDRMDEFRKNQLAQKLFKRANFPTGDAAAARAADTNLDCIVEEGKVEVWSGVRPVNKRGRLPLVRRVHGSKRVSLVSGFGSNGFVMCWNGGPRVAEMVL